MTEKTWGALPEDWQHLDIILGLAEDLLPVVSNPGAVVSAKSTIKAMGKVPSLYNKDGKAVGISGWTDKKAKAPEIAAWSGCGDYGICIQTRKVVALDVDVEDAQVCAHIRGLLLQWLPSPLALRCRAGSNKFLVVFEVEGHGEGNDLYKRVMPVRGGIVELLGTGQQFIACGTHTGGKRYEWEGGLPFSLPTISRASFEILWETMRIAVATGEVRESSASRHQTAGNTAMAAVRTMDYIASALLETGAVIDTGRQGELFLRCPFESHHSDPSMEPGTSTAYFPAGTGGYETGHFKCLHAHCAGRSDGEFVSALGIAAAQFDVVEEDAIEGLPDVLEALESELITNDDNRILATLSNIKAILSRPDLCGIDLRYDNFRAEIVYSLSGWSPGRWVAFNDTDYTELRYNLEKTGFNPVSREMMRDCVHWVAKTRSFDTAIEWLNGLKWDGVPRVAGFMSRYMMAEPDKYTTSVSEYMWSAMAGRILSPGCKADGAILFTGEQLAGKTHAVMSLVPDPKYYCEINFEDKDDDLARKMRGKLVCEFAEMRGFEGRASESTKAFISRQVEEWTPKYMEYTVEYPRRSLFFGTSNNDELLGDDTGNRREFPIRVGIVDCEAIKHDREQLWAEGAVMFRMAGIENYYRKANNLADMIRQEFMITDSWDEAVFTYLYEKDVDGKRVIDIPHFTASDVLRNAIHLDTKSMKKYDTMRLGKMLRRLGCEKILVRDHGVVKKAWRKKPN
jgi:predicted P-loop ATPase